MLHQHGRRFFVFEHQYSCRDVICKRSIELCHLCYLFALILAPFEEVFWEHLSTWHISSSSLPGPNPAHDLRGRRKCTTTQVRKQILLVQVLVSTGQIHPSCSLYLANWSTSCQLGFLCSFKYLFPLFQWHACKLAISKLSA